jgi:hypothetical protein
MRILKLLEPFREEEAMAAKGYEKNMIRSRAIAALKRVLINQERG